jgi:hypothetical protein
MSLSSYVPTTEFGFLRSLRSSRTDTLQLWNREGTKTIQRAHKCLLILVCTCHLHLYWPLVPKFLGSNQAEAVAYFRAKKTLSTTSFGGEVKPSVPCRRFAACKRSLKGAWNSLLSAKLPEVSRPTSSALRC